MFDAATKLQVRGGDGSYGLLDFRRLQSALDSVIVAETQRLAESDDPALDRAAIRAAFDDNGFAGFYCGIDFDADERRFTRQLERAYMQYIPGLVQAHSEDAINGVSEGPVLRP